MPRGIPVLLPLLSRYPCFQRCFCTKNYTHAMQNLLSVIISCLTLCLSLSFLYYHYICFTHIHAPYHWFKFLPIKCMPTKLKKDEKKKEKKEMEGGDQSGGSRWNPTKEQINMLEGLYKQGLRTPSAEQIQQITASLRHFGHIEGKNVFYWFQNHKARQRQKQKQEAFAYYNRCFQLHAAPLFPPYPNVVCSPCYVPQQKNDPKLMYHQHYPKVPLPTAESSSDQSLRYNTTKSTDFKQTLDLFPIHPTGILQSRNGINDDDDDVREIKNPNSKNQANGNDNGPPYFDFFCGN